eukprot:3620911-Prymnesium_polylepis.1
MTQDVVQGQLWVQREVRAAARARRAGSSARRVAWPLRARGPRFAAGGASSGRQPARVSPARRSGACGLP